MNAITLLKITLALSAIALVACQVYHARRVAKCLDDPSAIAKRRLGIVMALQSGTIRRMA